MFAELDVSNSVFQNDQNDESLICSMLNMVSCILFGTTQISVTIEFPINSHDDNNDENILQ